MMCLRALALNLFLYVSVMLAIMLINLQNARERNGKALLAIIESNLIDIEGYAVRTGTTVAAVC